MEDHGFSWFEFMGGYGVPDRLCVQFLVGVNSSV